MKFSAIKPLIIESIGERFCTADGIKKYVEPKINAEINAQDFDLVLYRMTVQKDIVRLNNGGFSAFFKPNSVPVRFFMAGGGRVNLAFDNENVGLPVMVSVYDKRSEGFIEEIAVIPYFTERQLAQIEDLTARGLSNREIAGEMAIDEYMFARRTRQDLPTRQAISEGHKRLKSGDVAPKQVVEAPVTAKEVAKPEKPTKMRPRVVDVRPFAKLVQTESITDDTPTVAPHRLRLKRLCVCGNPLGARTRECRECWLKIKYPGEYSNPKPTTTVDRRIRNILSENEIAHERFSKILLAIFLETSPDAVKERFASALCDELLEASREAA